MSRPSINNGPSKSEERKRPAGANTLKLPRKRSETAGDTHAKAKAGGGQASPERNQRAVNSGPRFALDLEDYDEDKP